MIARAKERMIVGLARQLRWEGMWNKGSEIRML